MNITVRLPLRTSKRKRNKIKKAIEREREVAEFFANKMPSFGREQWGGRPNKSMRHSIRNEFPDNNGVKYTHYLYKLANHISDIYNNWRKDKYKGKRPDFSNIDYLTLCNCGTNEIQFEKNNGVWGVNIPLLKEEDKKDWFRLRTGDYQDKLLEKSKKIADNPKIVKKRGRYELHQPVELEEEEDYDPETKIGVDMGLNNIATIAVVNGSVGQVEFFGGAEVRHYREKMWKRRKELQEKGLNERLEEIKNLERRFSEHQNHRISKRIVEIASEYDNPIIKMEDLENIRDDINKRTYYRKDRRYLNNWAFGQLQDFIAYKAEKEGIKTKKIDPKNTSKKCYKCGELTRRPYKNNIELCYCGNCEEERNADFNAAMNIAG